MQLYLSSEFFNWGEREREVVTMKHWKIRNEIINLNIPCKWYNKTHIWISIIATNPWKKSYWPQIRDSNVSLALNVNGYICK